jgi:hypothetical protein
MRCLSHSDSRSYQEFAGATDKAILKTGNANGQKTSKNERQPPCSATEFSEKTNRLQQFGPACR